MRKTATVVIMAAMLAVGFASSASADPTQNTSSSYGIEGAFGLQAGDLWLSVYGLAYDVDEGGQVSKIVVPTVFVDGDGVSMECFAFTDEGDVTVAPSLSGGSYSATIEGFCFDYLTEESVPFSITLDVEATGTGVTRIRGGSYADGTDRCVSKISERSAVATGHVSIQIPDRAIDVTDEVSDEFTNLTGFSQRCYATNATLPGDDH